MPLPTPLLDDRHFQDIVDDAKRLIPLYCPEWTDHNVSDPGVALIELFAWMTDMLLYRVNQVPDKNYIKFLEMMGIQLAEPQPADAPITFRLSAVQPTAVTIPTGTEVATVRTETNPAIIFTTTADLTIQPPTLIDVFTRDISQRGVLTRHNFDARKADLLEQLGQLGQRISIFPPKPSPQDAFMLAFEKNISNHLLELGLTCELAGGAGLHPDNPPLRWEVWQNAMTRWMPCELESDSTLSFNQPGKVVLHVPTMEQKEFQGLNAYWLRCVLTDAQNSEHEGFYKKSPILLNIHAEAWGGTVNAQHAIFIENEVLGVSDGRPGQTFHLLHTPVLALGKEQDKKQERLLVEPATGEPQQWQAVSDFADAGPDDRHFTLDKLDGTVSLGPSLLQPDKSVKSYGKVPEKGSILRFSRYRYGGGVVGNVAQNTLTVLKASIPYISSVTNRMPAEGGRDAQSLDDAKLRAPKKLRNRSRAVTADDYEYLACEVPGVARARCLAPGAQPGDRNDPKPGQIFVMVLPQLDTPQGHIALERLELSADLRQAVLLALNKSRLLGITLDVQKPQYIFVSIQVGLHVSESEKKNALLLSKVQQRAEEVLYRYVNPYTGGPDGKGWPFGRPLNRSEIYSVLQNIDGVEFVDDVQISMSAIGGGSPQPVSSVPVLRHSLICSDKHEVKVS